MTDEYSELHPLQREAQNNFSFWFPKIQNCGIAAPESLTFNVPAELYQHFFMEEPVADVAAIQVWMDGEVYPALEKSPIFRSPLFIKNAVYSGKFNAANCMATMDQFAWAFANINYDALCVGADGCDELVVRRRIQHDIQTVPCIYNGLPLRPEFRVFYDFTKREVIFTANYWDWDYVYPHLYAATDKLVFEHEREHIATTFIHFKAEVEAMVAKSMANVTGLDGPWSIDLLLDTTHTPDGPANQWWLIDMAVAEQSAYWELRPGNEAALAAQKAKEAEHSASMDALTVTSIGTQ